jgi:hypothetical protein
MPEESRPTLWLVGEYDYDSYSPHAVFTAEEDARAFAQAVGDEVEELPLFGPGEQPEIVEAWVAYATVVPKPYSISLSVNGRTSVTTYDNEPPKVERYSFSPLKHVPAWARQPCAVTNCETGAGGLYIRFRGSDRDAVLDACTRRYEAGLDAMGARR